MKLSMIREIRKLALIERAIRKDQPIVSSKLAREQFLKAQKESNQ